jgi:hypothetical protein
MQSAVFCGGKTEFLSILSMNPIGGTRWRICLRHCTKNWKVAGSIPDGVIGIFSDVIFLAALSY